MTARPIHLALLALAAACSDPPPAAPPAAETPPAEAAPAAPTGPTVAERRARFEARPTVDLPDDLPPAWRGYAKALDGRLVEARHAVRSHPGRAGYRAVSLTIRVFGLDDAVRARVHGALAGLDLPELPPLADAGEDFWRGEVIVDGPVRWRIDIGRLVAPPGEPREQIVALEWTREPPPAAPDVRDCRKPPAVPAPASAPAWLSRTTSKRTTRRRVTAEIRRTAKAKAIEERIELRMLFRNSYAHDEHLRHLAEAAAKAGFTREGDAGTRQRWAHPDGSRFTFAPETAGDLKLGCTLAGPALRLTLTRSGG